MEKKAFGLIIKPVGPLCNLDCKYCFYIEKLSDFEKEEKLEKFLMEKDVLEEFTKQFILSQPDFVKELNFVWQGGEPGLAGIDFYEEALSIQKAYLKSDMKIQNIFQTNGTLLTDDYCRFLKDNNFLVGISIDGPESLHNAFRVKKNNSGTFKDVMRGVELLHKHNVEFNTMTMVHSKNVLHPERVYRFLKNIGSTFMQFIPCVEARISDEIFSTERGIDPRLEVSGVSARTVSPIKYGSFLNSIFDLWLKTDIGKVFVQDFDNTLAMIHGFQSNLCVYCENCSPNFVLEHNGDVFSCDHLAFDRDRLGNILENNFIQMMEMPEFDDFVNAKSRLPEKCLDCMFLSICSGGCPSNRIFVEANNVKIDYLCDGHRLFYAHAARYFQAMSAAINAGYLAVDYARFLK